MSLNKPSFDIALVDRVEARVDQFLMVNPRTIGIAVSDRARLTRERFQSMFPLTGVALWVEYVGKCEPQVEYRNVGRPMLLCDHYHGIDHTVSILARYFRLLDTSVGAELIPSQYVNMVALALLLHDHKHTRGRLPDNENIKLATAVLQGPMPDIIRVITHSFMAGTKDSVVSMLNLLSDIQLMQPTSAASMDDILHTVLTVCNMTAYLIEGTLYPYQDDIFSNATSHDSNLTPLIQIIRDLDRMTFVEPDSFAQIYRGLYNEVPIASFLSWTIAQANFMRGFNFQHARMADVNLGVSLDEAIEVAHVVCLIARQESRAMESTQVVASQT